MWRVAGGEKVIDPKHFSYVFTITTWSSSPSCSNSPTLEDSYTYYIGGDDLVIDFPASNGDCSYSTTFTFDQNSPQTENRFGGSVDGVEQVTWTYTPEDLEVDSNYPAALITKNSDA